jgi:Fe-S-cluster formation regulator IscX/YfhJ
MSVDPDLSFIGVDVDPEKVEPIDLKKLIVSINEFLIRSCDILNNFAGKMEESILELEYRLDRVETELLLLEKRVCYM